MPEQRAICVEVDLRVSAVSRALGAARREIDMLREFRTRLIADVVTGKVDVSEIAASLPEEPRETAQLDEAEGEDGADEAEGGPVAEETKA